MTALPHHCGGGGNRRGALATPPVPADDPAGDFAAVDDGLRQEGHGRSGDDVWRPCLDLDAERAEP